MGPVIQIGSRQAKKNRRFLHMVKRIEVKVNGSTSKNIKESHMNIVWRCAASRANQPVWGQAIIIQRVAERKPK